MTDRVNPVQNRRDTQYVILLMTMGHEKFDLKAISHVY
jgi:hypothetical protein